MYVSQCEVLTVVKYNIDTLRMQRLLKIFRYITYHLMATIIFSLFPHSIYTYRNSISPSIFNHVSWYYYSESDIDGLAAEVKDNFIYTFTMRAT